MEFLQGLHGTVAAILICSLLFVDEAGIPLPIAPNEALLLLTGVLIAGGAFPLVVIFPIEYVVMAAGMIAGYTWARSLGGQGLATLAARLHATEAYERVQTRLQTASPLGIGLARMIPGLRPYATLVSGAAEVDPRTFLLGALPALLLWEILLIVIGVLVGLPVAHLLGRFEKVFLRGAVLILLGVVAWFAVRAETDDRRGGIVSVAPRLRATLALAVDAAIVFSVVGGVFAVGRKLMDIRANGWIEAIVAAVLLIGLLLFGRRHQTPGEILFDTNYWHPSQPRHGSEQRVPPPAS